MARPTIIPTWATDPTLTAGPQAGLAPRLDPGAGVRAQGIYQGRRVPARVVGWLFGVIGDWLGYFDSLTVDAGIREWDTYTIDSFGLSTTKFLLPFIPAGVAANIGALSTLRHLVAAVGTINSNGHSATVVLSDQPNIVPTPLDTGLAAFSCVAADSGDPGGSGIGSTIFGCLTGGATCKYSTNGGSSWSTFTPAAFLAGNIMQMFATGTAYLVADDAGTITRSTTLTGTWVGHTFHGGGVGTCECFASNGAGTICMLYAVSGNRTIAYSTDDGVTWADAQTFAGVSASLAWSAGNSCFVAITSTGELWTSPSGVSWTKQKTSAALATGITPGARQLACQGPVIAHIVNRSGGSLPSHMRGVSYTLDLGATWHEMYFGSYSFNGARDLVALTAANGKLFATDGVSLFRSGMLTAASAPNYSGV
jgi:hypothetical protein